MAYQNISTPRFYVNILEYLGAIGYAEINNVYRTNPTSMKPAGQDLTTPVPEGIFPEKSFVAYLGHKGGWLSWSSEGVGSGFTEIVNGAVGPTANALDPDHHGFSIASFNGLDVGAEITTWNTNEIGSIVVGNYYDMPHSPDLKLKISIEMDGVKNIKTKGGASLTGINYTKPPDWGDGGAWQLGLSDISNLNLNNEILLALYQEYWDEFPVDDGTLSDEDWELWFGAYQAGVFLGWLEEDTNPDTWMSAYNHLVYFTSFAGLDLVFTDNLRSGRRSWDLSFSYLSDTDVFPVNSSTAHGVYGTTEGYADEDTNDAGTSFNTNILTGENFFSQVWNRTMGGHLPFIFQPNGGADVEGAGYSNPDQFAICRFDMDSLQYEQVANNAYNVKLKIRESW